MMIVELSQPPSLPALYAKAIAGLLPGRRGGDLPDTELVLRGVRTDPARLADYARVCGFRLTDTLPPTYPHVLAFPLALALMTAPGFPFPAAGMVHVANRIELHRPVAVTEPLDLAVHAESLRPHRRGEQVDLVATAAVDTTPVWRGVSTYLHRSEPGSSSEQAAEPPPPSAIWRVGTELGPAYAAVSGDHNPIHTSRLAARAFGFRGRIAHGMWTKARCLSQLAPRLPEVYAVEVSFAAPVLLPARLGFSATAGTFAVHSIRSGRPHLTGTITAPG